VRIGHRPCRAFGVVCLTLILALGAAACGGTADRSRRSPTPAVSASALPGLSEADRQQDPAVHAATQERLIRVFLDPLTTAAEARTVAARIAAMPEVAAYHYVTHREALERLQSWAASPPPIAAGQMPPSFDILVRSAADAPKVAEGLRGGSLVDNVVIGDANNPLASSPTAP
jgi:hypothetical protein